MATPEEIDDYGRASPMGNDAFFYKANAITPVHKSPVFGGWTQTDVINRQNKVPKSDAYFYTGAPFAVVVLLSALLAGAVVFLTSN